MLPGLGLLLAGCFPPPLTSDPVTVPLAQRALVPELEGDFWSQPDGPKADAEFMTVRISPDAERRHCLAAHYRNGTTNLDGADTDLCAVLLKLGQPWAVLALAEENVRTEYVLMLRSQAGSWVLFGFLGDMDSPITGAREAYLAAVARRHGLALRWHAERDETRFDAPIDAARLAALFSDPAFLGGLKLDAQQGIRLYPMNRPPPPASDAEAWTLPETRDGVALSSLRFPMARAETAQPEGVAGSYGYGDKTLRMRALADGSYRVEYPADLSPGFGSGMVLRLLALPDPGRFLGLLEGAEPDERAPPGQERIVLVHKFTIVELAGSAITITPLRLAAPLYSSAMDRLVHALRAEVVQRHGLKLEDYRLAGPLAAGAVMRLFKDPQFQVGLYSLPDDPEAIVLEKRPSF
jgi:hypothetical protein